MFPDLHLDHVTPVHHGGSNDAENIVLACETCNCSRGHRNALPLRTGACPVPSKSHGTNTE